MSQNISVNENEDKPLTLQEIMDISPSMLSTSSPAKTDWLGQLICETNRPMYF